MIFIDQLFGIAVGDMKLSPTDFYQMSLKEINGAIEGHQKAIERDYNLLFLAMYNANGIIQGGKKFKPDHPFEDKKSRKKPTKKERDETLAWLKTEF